MYNSFYLKQVLGIETFIAPVVTKPIVLSLMPAESMASIKDKQSFELTTKILQAIQVDIATVELIEKKSYAEFQNDFEQWTARPWILIFCHSSCKNWANSSDFKNVVICPHPIEMLMNPDLKKVAWKMLKSWSLGNP